MISWWWLLIASVISGSFGCLMMSIFTTNKEVEWTIPDITFKFTGNRSERRRQWREGWKEWNN